MTTDYLVKMVVQTRRAFAAHDDLVRTIVPPFVSLERLLVDDFGDHLASTRAFETNTNEAVFSNHEWRDLRTFEAITVELRDLIYDKEKPDNDACSVVWQRAKTLAMELLCIHGWSGVLDLSLFGDVR